MRIQERGIDKTDKPWLVDASSGHTVYFKDIDKLTQSVASGLARLGFKIRDNLYYVTYETAILYVIQIGVWRLGGGVRGGFQKETPEEYARQMREAKAKFVVVDKETYPLVQETVKIMPWPVTVISFDDVGNPDVKLVKSLIEDDGTAMPEKVDINPKEDIICMPNTSASTGLPKGVCHSHFNFTTLNYDLKAVDVFQWPFMTPMSNYAIGSFMVTVCSITYGSTVYHLGKFAKEEYLDMMVKHKPGCALMYPFVCNWFARCDDLDKYDLSFLKIILVVGSVLDPTTAELIMKRLPHVQIVQFYGMSELIQIANTQVDTPLHEISTKKIATKENQGELCVTSGKLVPYTTVKIIDVNTGNMLGPNERGEIYIKSPHLMKGYLREGHDKPVLENVTEDGYLRTGDIGFLDEESNIYIMERTSFLFKYYMFIVSPTEIESVIKQHPDVLEAGVVDLPHPECTSVARAFVRTKPNSKCTEEDIIKFVADRMPDHKQLHGGVQFIDKFPESKGNKLDRIGLRKLALDKLSSEPYIFKSPLERDPSKLPECPIYDFLLKKIKEKGVDKTDKPWVVDASTGNTIYFKDIENLTRNIASGLTRLGFKIRDKLYYVTYETAVLYAIHLGIWRLSGGVRGGYQLETPDEYARQLRESKARFVLVDKETYPVVQETLKLISWPVKVISFDDVGNPDVVLVKSLLEDDGSAMPEKVDIKPKEDIIIMPNTSASTGLLKAGCHTHFSFTSFNYDPMAVDFFNWPFMTPMSNFAIGSFLATCSSITYGTTVYHLGKFEREKYLDQMVKYKPGNALMYPFLCNWFARCDELENYDLSFLHMITVVGAVLDSTTTDLINKRLPHVQIVQLYGSTETVNIANTQVGVPENEVTYQKIATKENEGDICVTSGKLAPYVQARIVDVDSGAFLGPNKRGEIQIKTPMIMKGYLREGHDEPVPEDMTDDGYFKTGDVGFFDEDSNIYVIERTKFIFKFQQWNVSPTEIETVIKKHPDVLEVGVVDVPDLVVTGKAIAFVRRKPNAKCTEEEIVKFVADREPERKQLHGGVRFIDKLPQNKGGKLDRIALKKMAMQL